MTDVVKEYYILSTAEQKEIFGVFDTLEECLTWKAKEEFTQSELQILRVKRLRNGTFKFQRIGWTV